MADLVLWPLFQAFTPDDLTCEPVPLAETPGNS
jgi:hypothetical protein